MLTSVNIDEAPAYRLTPEQALWIAVIKQAIYDYAFPRKVNTLNERRNAIRIERKARVWLFFAPDFEWVCHLANIEPDVVRRIAREARREAS